MNISNTPQSAKPDVPDGSLRSHESAGAEFVGQVQHRARESAQRVGEQARGLRDDGAEYVRRRPVQSLLIAAGVGAALMLSLRLLGRIASHAR
jgi:ElaB/YqjD/DUF883 family membrane-anchored ribosome-binding protein